MYGLPYAFASHFAPDELEHALAAYRSEFKPSAQLAEPYVIAGVNVTAADTAEDAREQFQRVRRARAASLFARQAGRSPADISDEQADQLLRGGAAAHVDHMLTSPPSAPRVRSRTTSRASSRRPGRTSSSLSTRRPAWTTGCARWP